MDPLASDINQGWSSGPPPPTAAQPTQPQAPASPSAFVREPKVYGDPGTTLMDPSAGAAHGAGSREPAPPTLRIRIAGLERNRKDLLIRFDASTNLPNFRTTLYRNMQRSYVEFQRFAEQLQMCCPQTIVPALPMPHTSAATDEEDDRLVRIALQRWFSRLCEDPQLQKEDEMRSFIESDFGYNPIPPPTTRRQGPSTAATQAFTAALSKVVRRGPLDEDDEINSARSTLERLEPAWAAAATSVANLGKARKALSAAGADVGSKLLSLATDETDMNLAAAERKTGRVYEQLAALGGSQIASENVVLNDALAYQAANARAGLDALTQRSQILEDSQSATKAAINKRRNVERLKGSSSINPIKVDDAIAEMEEATALESRLTNHINAISANLHTSLRSHSRNAHEDVAVSLLEHARMSIIFNRQILRELETLKPDLARVTAAPAPSTYSPAPPAAYPSPTGSQTNNSHMPPTPTRPSVPGTPQARPAPVAQSMFLPPQGGDLQRPQSAGSPARSGGSAVDPLSGAPMAQSMVLPGQRQGSTTPSRAPQRRLDERKAAKLLAGGF